MLKYRIRYSAVHVPVNLLGLPVAPQQTAEDPHTAHPAQLLGHASVRSTLPLTWRKTETRDEENLVSHFD